MVLLQLIRKSYISYLLAIKLLLSVLEFMFQGLKHLSHVLKHLSHVLKHLSHALKHKFPFVYLTFFIGIIYIEE